MVHDEPSPAGVATIVAVATPHGRGGLAVVRVSGFDAIELAASVCDHANLRGEVCSHRAFLADVRHPDTGLLADQALVLPMLAPGTYTGEDTVEFFCHGGDHPARLVVEACLAAGARAALAGEFTRRAFLNGRLSLDQAEAVADLIHAEDRLGARAALAQLRGGLRSELLAVEEPLMAAAVELEGALEFEEDEGIDLDWTRLRGVVTESLSRIDALLDDAIRGRRVRNGVQVVIAGPVNAGKSSLFNALLGSERAIVDPDAGTTRDVIHERRLIDGVPFVFHDTAGLREHTDRVESEGITRTRSALEAADLVLWTSPRDAVKSTPLPEALPEGTVLIVVGTKCDLNGEPHPREQVATSAVLDQGLDALRAAMSEAAQSERLQDVAAAGRALSRRHRERLVDTRKELQRLEAMIDQGVALDVVATQISAALKQLGEVTGRVYSERLLTEIFQSFCVGK